MSMWNKRPLKKLLGLGVFACASAVLLSVTAQSARSERVPTVSEVGSMIGGTFRFVETLKEEAAENADPTAIPVEIPEEPEIDWIMTPLDVQDPAPDSSETAMKLDDLSGLSDSLSLSSASSASSDEPASGVDSLQSGTAIASDAGTAAAGASSGDDWMTGETPSDGAEKKAPAGEAGQEESKNKQEAGAGKQSDAAETPTAGEEEAAETAGDFMETDDGGEELVAAASVTLSLQANNKNHTEYLHGYEDGTARPGGTITRAEACQILYNLLASKPSDRAVLKDVKDSDWFAEPVRLLAAYGIIDTPNDKARPTDYMTRAELVSALSRLVAANTSARVTFTDVPASHPYYADIAKAVGLKWVNGYEDGTFKPDGSITRAEAAKVVNRALSRTPDTAWIDGNLSGDLYSDLTKDHWAYYELMEASVAHTVGISGGKETWNPVSGDSGRTAPAEEPTENDAQKPDEGAETEEETHEGSTPETKEWSDEELERMLAEPLPDPVDPELLQFEGNELYAVDGKGERQKDVTLGRYLTFDKDGRYTSGDESLDKIVKEILDEITTEDMTREEKLKAAYEYVRDSYEYRRRNIYKPGDTGWEAEEALTMYTKKKGNCYNYTAAFAMLARRLGYDAEAVSGLVGSELQEHGWVEIVVDGERLLYDTTLECSYRAKGINYDFFGIRYATAPWPYHKH